VSLLGPGAVAWAGLALISCGGVPRLSPEELLRLPERAMLESGHAGPPVPALIDVPAGPARFARQLYEGFDRSRAMASVAFVDGFYRAPGNDGFEACLDHVRERLEAAGFGAREGLLLEVLSTPLGEPAWTPLSARLALHAQGKSAVLHAFDSPQGADRTMLPVGAISGAARGPVAFRLEDVDPGEILVVEEPGAGDPAAAAGRGARAVLVASLEDYNVDPTPKERHLDAIQFRSVRRGAPIPCLQVSRRSHRAILAAVKADPRAELELEAVVRTDERPLRTLVATVVGADRPEQCVVTVAHVQEPGAVDNASGVGGICEAACTLAACLAAEGPSRIERPSRSVVFLFGDEMRESRLWLEAGRRTSVAAISADMIGASLEHTGAAPLLERGPDPGAVVPLPPDQHTAWGSSRVEYSSLAPNGVSLVARVALADIGALAGGWKTNEHPYEGGSDHDVFLRAGVPAALLWHFTDFAYHTSLDRLPHVDSEELRRMSCAVVAAILALADPRPGDLDRYLHANAAERRLRVAAAREAKNDELAHQWELWTDSVRHWFRRECLRLTAEEAPVPTPEKKR
jgi:aminopeptidase YwaD